MCADVDHLLLHPDSRNTPHQQLLFNDAKTWRKQQKMQLRVQLKSGGIRGGGGSLLVIKDRFQQGA